MTLICLLSTQSLLSYLLFSILSGCHCDICGSAIVESFFPLFCVKQFGFLFAVGLRQLLHSPKVLVPLYFVPLLLFSIIRAQ